MQRLFSELHGAVMATLVLAIDCCGIYPLVVFGISQALFRDKANGSLIVDSSGTIRGSRLLGQQFTADKYFHARPSAAGNGYDATSSGGSNLGPTSKKLADSIAQNVADYRTQNGLGTNDFVPADAVTASGSGLDPHISVRNAELQAPRVARVPRFASPKRFSNLRMLNTPMRLTSSILLRKPGVNVLKLNLALNNLSGGAQGTK